MNKTMIFSFLLLVLFTSCGKNNQSGRTSGGLYNGLLGGVNGLGTIAGAPVNTNTLLNTVMQDYPCQFGGGRIATPPIPLQLSVALNALYVGVTSEGDVAVVTSSNGQGVLNTFVCNRGIQAGAGSLMGNPVVNKSYFCAVDEITAARMVLPGNLILNFRAIQYGRGSRLCHQ